MKHVVLASVAAFALLMSGCSQKNPEVDTSANSASNGSGGSDSMDMSDADRLNALISKLQSEVKNVYFDFDKFNIRSDMQSVVNANAALFNKDEAKNISVKVEGNCDEWGTDEYNYALGLKRAKAVKDSLVAQGVNADRISVVSYGESNPVCTEKSKACDAQNRRDEFKLLP